MNKFVGIHILDCNGEKHRIGIPVSGSVVLFNHRGKSGKHARLIQDMFTQKECACTQFLNEWKHNNKGDYSWKREEFPILTNNAIRQYRRKSVPNRKFFPVTEGQAREEYRQRLFNTLEKYRWESEDVCRRSGSKHMEFNGFDLGSRYARVATMILTSDVQKRSVDKKTYKIIYQRACVDYSDFVKLVVNKCHIVDGQVLTRIVDKSDDSIWEVEAIRFVDAELPRSRSNSPVCPYKQAVIQKAWIARVGPGYPWLTLTWQS